MSQRNKRVVRRLVDEVINHGKVDVTDELFDPRLEREARRWVEAFRRSFPDVRMTVVDLVAEGDKVVGRFTCSGTHEGDWRGHPPSGRRFEHVDEVYFFRFDEGRIVEAWGIEDTAERLRQLGLAMGSDEPLSAAQDEVTENKNT